MKNLKKYLIQMAQKNWLDTDQVMDKINYSKSFKRKLSLTSRNFFSN